MSSDPGSDGEPPTSHVSATASVGSNRARLSQERSKFQKPPTGETSCSPSVNPEIRCKPQESVNPNDHHPETPKAADRRATSRRRRGRNNRFTAGGPTPKRDDIQSNTNPSASDDWIGPGQPRSLTRCPRDTLRSTPLGNLDPAITLFEEIFLAPSAKLLMNRGFHMDYLGRAQTATALMATALELKHLFRSVPVMARTRQGECLRRHGSIAHT